MTAHEHDLQRGEGLQGVGAANYCPVCLDRVCFECGRTGRAAGGGTWMSGHCFECQGPVIRRQDAERRRQAVADGVFRRGEYVDGLAADIERMRLTGEQAVKHLRLVAQLLREESDKAMQERPS